jgi:hypothetical protein
MSKIYVRCNKEVISEAIVFGLRAAHRVNRIAAYFVGFISHLLQSGVEGVLIIPHTLRTLVDRL